MKNKKHDEITKDYAKTKNKHLERLATQMLKNDEKFCKLKQLNIDPDVLNLF
jgi:predicted transposase YdaD